MQSLCGSEKATPITNLQERNIAKELSNNNQNNIETILVSKYNKMMTKKGKEGTYARQNAEMNTDNILFKPYIFSLFNSNL